MSIAGRRVVTGFCVAAPLAHDQRLIVSNVPRSGIGSLCMLLIPSDVFVDPDDIKYFAQRVIDNLVRASRGLLRADEKRCGDKTSVVKLMREINHSSKILGASFRVGRLI